MLKDKEKPEEVGVRSTAEVPAVPPRCFSPESLLLSQRRVSGSRQKGPAAATPVGTQRRNRQKAGREARAREGAASG